MILINQTNISANIMTKKNGQYIVLDRVESICQAMNCSANDVMGFVSYHRKERKRMINIG